MSIRKGVYTGWDRLMHNGPGALVYDKGQGHKCHGCHQTLKLGTTPCGPEKSEEAASERERHTQVPGFERG